ncbi:MAG: response regulator transcription factor [Deinococcota bacterium]
MATQTTPVTVMIVDDHELVREGIRSFLDSQTDIDVLAEASNGRDAIRLAAEHVPDVVLMDLMMPQMGGVEATRQLKQVSPTSQVVILTSYHDDEHIFPALRAGARSYVLKTLRPAELADAVRRAARGEAVLHPQVAARVIRDMQDPNTRDQLDPLTELTERELQVLKLIAEGQNNQSIADDLGISERTVKGHVSNILAKLHLNDRTQAAVLAWREGVMKHS